MRSALFSFARPVRVCAYAGDERFVEACDVDDGGGGDDVAVVYAAEGYAVGFEGPCDEEDALVELAQEDDALAAEAAGEEDEDCARGERVAVFGGVCGFARLNCCQVGAWRCGRG